VRRLARDTAIGTIPLFLSDRVMVTISTDGMGAGLIHFLMCLLLIEAVTQIIKALI